MKTESSYTNIPGKRVRSIKKEDIMNQRKKKKIEPF